ncbi:MAG TPA: DsbA family protein [Nitrolancea sp.]|nr:DsbA family protein [Nitrolancea sp.]
MTATNVPEVWEWAEYYCPWCYITAVRLHQALPEYQGRVKLRIRPFPLEVLGGGPAPRDILEQEWWLAALQEPTAAFALYEGDDWPTTTLPAFEAFWCALQQDEALALNYDLRIRRAFFAESRNIGRREVLFELAEAVGLDMAAFLRTFESGKAREAVLAEGRIGKQQFGVRGTPTVMLADGSRLKPPIAFPKMQQRKIVAIGPLPCCGDGCRDATRGLFEQALATQSSVGSLKGSSE